jgi:hypothetical protein
LVTVTLCLKSTVKEYMSRKSWCFTLNNYLESDELFLSGIYDGGELSYLIYGRELSSTGTPHLQGFVTFKRTCRLGALKRKWGDRYHFESARNPVAAIKYCRKDGDVVEFGTYNRGRRGERSDLHGAAEELLEHRDLGQFKLEHPDLWVKYSKGFGSLLDKSPRREPPTVTWIWGSTGVGKTRYVVGREPNIWISGRNLRWFDGYFEQPAVLFDDFRRDFCTFHFLLRLLDRYPCGVEVKGNTIPWNPKRIYITTPNHPSTVYETREDKNQLLRRCDRILELVGPGTSVERQLESNEERIEVSPLFWAVNELENQDSQPSERESDTQPSGRESETIQSQSTEDDDSDLLSFMEF